MKRRAYFIPFQGCSRRCVYCDQIVIAGDAAGSVLTPERVAAELAAYDAPVELCFFGGSFARLPLATMTAYLETVRAARPGSRVTFSSYPDDFDGDAGRARIEILARYPIGTVELGVPSLDPEVLRACNRHDDPARVRRAFINLASANIHPGAQIMIGLPGQAERSALRDLETIAAWMRADDPGGAWDLRIYPCLVLRGTELARMYRARRYTPLSLEEAVRQSGALLAAAHRCGLNPIRVGLSDSASLRDAVAAGPYHPAFGELARSEQLARELTEDNPGGPWRVQRRLISQLTGHGGWGLRRLAELNGKTPEEVQKILQFIN